MFLSALKYDAKLGILSKIPSKKCQYVVMVVSKVTRCNSRVFCLTQFVRIYWLIANKLKENGKTCIISVEKFFVYYHFVVTLHRE